jgi:Schlafen, AlbA_2
MKMKPIYDLEPSEFTFEIVENLINQEIPENSFIEYKGNWFLTKQSVLNDHKANLAQKICALANSQGGFIFFGIEELRKGDITIAGKITGKEIKNFESIIQSVILSGTNPPCPFNLHKVEKNKTIVYILKIYTYLSPIMLSMKNHAHQYTFPIRINEQTQYAERDHVKFLFANHNQNLLIQSAMQDIWGSLKKICDKIGFPQITKSIMRRLFIKYETIMPKLDLIPLDTKNSSYAQYHIFFKDHFRIQSDGKVLDMLNLKRDIAENHILFMEILHKIKTHWKKQFNYEVIC